MARTKPKRMMVIGLDGMCAKMVERFAREGVVPNLARLVRRGTLTRMIPVVPAQTPTNWTTLGTGAYPGTHEVSVWGTHRPGLPLEEHFAQEAMSSNICRAEYMWEAAASQGLNSLLVNYVGYPPTCERTTFIEWAQGPTAFHFQIARPGAYRTGDVEGECQPVALRPAEGWTGLPTSRRKPLETTLAVQPVRDERAVTLHAAVLALRSSGYDTVLVAPTKDAHQAVRCTVGTWTDWLTCPFRVGRRKLDGTVRFKLIELSGSAKRLWLYRSQVYPLSEFTYPPSLGAKLTKHCGPFIHEAAWNSRHVWHLCDDATCEEELVYHARWVGRAVRYLWDRLGVRVYYQHMHLLDCLNHRYLSAVDPTAIAYGRIPARQGWAAFRQGYRMVDAMVGEVIKAAGPDTLIAVCSDHGDVPNRRAVSLWRLFHQRGWVRLRKGPDGTPEVDPARTKMHINQNHIWLNLKGRDPKGVVNPSDYESLRSAVLDAMRDLKDPADGTRAIGLAMTREEAAVLGMYGPAVGDIVFYYAKHYRWSGPEVFRMGITDVVFDDPGGANHGPQPPNCQTDVSDNAGALILAGPGVRRKHVRDPDDVPPMFTADLVPTLCHLTGIAPPHHAEGKVVRDLMVGYRGKMPRRRGPIDAVPVRPKRTRRPALAGDVTDEE